jgi:galactokinase
MIDQGLTEESAELSRDFIEMFGVEPNIFAAPGRVNLIGEHTDYNDGFVMPCAIGFLTRVAISSRPDRKLLIQSTGFPELYEFDLDDLPERGIGAWCDYVLGPAAVLRRAGHSLAGANLLVRGEVPIGAGLSSSAAIEVASALALMSFNGPSLSLPEVAELCQRAENSFVGARVGVMDQFISCMGKAGHALLLDCRSLEYKLIPIPDNVCFVICHTMVKHEHASGEYNRRREQCEAGVKLLSTWYPGIRALRDIVPEHLMRHSREIPDLIYRRCLHVVQENQRTCQAAHCLASGDLGGFGHLMKESHRSLRDLYEVTGFELDTMVEIAEGLPGFHGGRMTGGGFGGCTVNLVDTERAPEFAKQISDRYQRALGIKPNVYVCFATDGARSEG